MSIAVLAQRALVKNDWPIVEIGGLPLVQSPLFSSMKGLKHAFTTRNGGHSEAPLESFNLGRHWNTDSSRVDALENRDRLCEALGLAPERLVVPGQQHTTNIYIADGTEEPRKALPALDGVATEKAEVPVLLHFADCVPVMIFDPVKRTLCVMHAGWRGTAGGIVKKGVELLCRQFGSRPNDMVAAVGPAIGSCCYETGEEVVDQLKTTVSDITALIERKNGKPFPDLKAVNALQLIESGVGQVDVTAWCTACHPDIFYSHRQSAGKTGRQGALACIE